MLKLFYKVIIIISITLIAYFYSNAQSLQLVSVDASKYPTITMDFFAKDAKGNDVHNFNAGDITITDMPCTNIIPSLVYCPPATQSKYSLIITLDYSGSMFNDLLKNGRPKYTAVVQAAKAIIAALPSDRTRWECAVTAFSSCCKLVQDFTTDSLKLVQAIDNVYKFQGGQTDYNAGFLYCCHQSNPGYGSLRIANNAKNKPIVIFLTDGDQDYQTACSGEPSRSSVWTGQISQEAANLKIPATIFSIIVGVSTGAVPASRIALQNISTGTPHGEYFETNSVNAQDITDIFLDLLSKSDTIGSSAPCRVSWDACCKGGQKVTMAIKSLGVSQDTSYTVNDSTRWKECDSCKNIPFDYINFNNPDNIILNGNAFKFDSVIRLTDNRLNMSGSAFIKYLIPIDMGFSSSFSFRFSQGSNLSCDDGSLPGADGFAFVIQNSGSTAIGWFGGSIGYEGISNSLAVEFDTYSNDSTQIENYFDPNGNHIAVQSLGSKPNTSKHKPEALLGINKNILVMKPDGTIYYSTIEYDAVYHQLNIYLDTIKSFKSVLQINNIDLTKILNLYDNRKAYLGFTAATGCASEIHDIIDWSICIKSPEKITDVAEAALNDNYVKIAPNPFSEKLIIQFNKLIFNNTEIQVYDLLGNKLISKMIDVENLNREFEINTSEFTTGIYIIKIRTGANIFINKTVKIR